MRGLADVGKHSTIQLTLCTNMVKHTTCKSKDNMCCLFCCDGCVSCMFEG